jgi:IMP dehydrogenase
MKFKHGPELRGLGFNQEMYSFLAALAKNMGVPVPRIEPLFLEFEDVRIAQRHSRIDHRSEILLRTRFSRNVRINTPIVSAPMATVTGSEMAITQALLGGLGIIHRGMTIEEHVIELRRVKRKVHMGRSIDDPVTLTYNHTKRDAIEALDGVKSGRKVGSIIIVDTFEENHVVGIVTPRDTKSDAPDDTPLDKIMSRAITGPHNISMEEAERILRNDIRKKQLPLVDEKGCCAGLITLQDIELMKEFPNASLDSKGRLLAAIALGLEDLVDRAEALSEEEPDVFVLDIAHGGMDKHLKAIRYLKQKYDIDVVAANVHEPDIVDLIRKASADGCRVGIGPGAFCTTSLNTGVGGSQLTAVLRCAEVAQDMPIIADGGIRYGRDLAGAIGAGASSVMIGTAFAGTEETPGQKLPLEDGTLAKKHFGMASDEARMILQNLAQAGLVRKDRLGTSPEGKEDVLPYRGDVSPIISSFLGWLKSSMSYVGARTIEEMPKRVRFNVRFR